MEPLGSEGEFLFDKEEFKEKVLTNKKMRSPSSVLGLRRVRMRGAEELSYGFIE